jgi:transposase
MKAKRRESLKPVRFFSAQIKQSVVKDIEDGKCSVSQAGRELSVCPQTIYKWIYRYSRYLQKSKIMVVEDQSEAYRTKELEKRIKELEAALGRKGLELEYYKCLVEVTEEHYQVDLKKNFGPTVSKGLDTSKE